MGLLARLIAARAFLYARTPDRDRDFGGAGLAGRANIRIRKVEAGKITAYCLLQKTELRIGRAFLIEKKAHCNIRLPHKVHASARILGWTIRVGPTRTIGVLAGRSHVNEARRAVLAFA